MRAAVLSLLAVLIAGPAVAETAKPPAPTVPTPQTATTCSQWKAICDSRGPGCEAKFADCVQNGCWSEAARFGGARHCGLARR